MSQRLNAPCGIGSVPMSRHISGDKIVVVETRRRWSEEERRQAVDETMTAPVSSVARRRGIAKSLLFRWRKEAGLSGKRIGAKKPSASFVPMALPAPLSMAETARGSLLRTQDRGLIEIELAAGRKLRVTGPVDANTLKQVIAVLEGR